jgi:hypothetical protein
VAHLLGSSRFFVATGGGRIVTIISDRIRLGIATCTGVLCLGLAPAATAQTDGAKEEKSDSQKTVERLNALTKAVDDLRAKPADTLATGGGKLEGYILSARAIQGAAKEIATRLWSKDSETPPGAIIMTSAEVAATDPWFAFEANAASLCLRLVGNAKCNKPLSKDGGPSPTPPGPSALGGAVVPILTAVLPFFSSFLRSETEISSLGKGLESDALLTTAVAHASNGKASLFVPPRITGSIYDSVPWTTLSALIDRRNDFVSANSEPNDEQAAMIKTVDAFVTGALARDDKGKVPILDVIRAHRTDADLSGKALLVVDIDQSDGTVLKRKGIDVALGAPSVRASGGVIVTYHLRAPSPAKDKQGLLACTTRLTELKRVHEPRRPIIASCD